MSAKLDYLRLYVWFLIFCIEFSNFFPIVKFCSFISFWPKCLVMLHTSTYPVHICTRTGYLYFSGFPQILQISSGRYQKIWKEWIHLIHTDLLSIIIFTSLSWCSVMVIWVGVPIRVTLLLPVIGWQPSVGTFGLTYLNHRKAWYFLCEV